MMKLLCVFLLFIQTHYTSALVEGRLNVVTKTKYAQTKYYTGCGWWGKRCTRYSTRAYKEHTCKPGYRSTNNVDCPYAICDGDINPTGACNIDYQSSHIIYSNGNTQFSSGGTCSTPDNCVNCNEGFYSSAERCRMCSAISNCDLETCTSSTNQQCARCEGVYAESPGKRAYKVSTDRRACGKACSWRSDSTRCYPGTCPTELASSCQCMEEFSGHHCQTIETHPSIVFNTLKLLGSGLKVKEAPENPNEGSPQDVSWTNINDSRRIQYKFTSEFIPKSQLPDAPAYIADYAVGIIYGVVNFKLFRDGEDIKNQTRKCTGVSRSSPHQAVFTCQDDILAGEVLDLLVNSGDILEFSFESKNGGFVKVLNFERVSTKETFFFEGKTQVNTFRLAFDFIRPHHCSVDINSTCTDNMLTVPIATTMSPVPVKWEGWLDDVGVYVYRLSLYDLVERNKTDNNSKLTDHLVVDTKNIFHPEVEYDWIVTSPGVYGLVMSVYDKAGNYKSARRIFIYDGTSQVETVHNSVLLVKSAAQQTQYTWQWTTGPVEVDWNLRYINKLHDSYNWLKGVEAVPDVASDYDDNGISRGTEPIPNIQAIVEYRTSFLVDHAGGSSITSTPPDSQFSTQMLSQQQTVSPDLVDGDTLRFWIRAYDIRREFLEENVTVHIDTSPPVIEDLWLTRGDRLNVSVHSGEEFSKMTFEWVSFDIHSGLETVSWRLFDNITGQDILHGKDSLSPQGETKSLHECNRKYGHYPRGSKCYCTPGVGCYHRHYQVTPNIISSCLTHGGVFHNFHTGIHDFSYFLEVTVMNQAKMFTKRDLKITIDASPPHSGHVYEGISGEPDIDFQSELVINAHWEGFFDSESDVKFYQYGFADHCLSEESFGLNKQLSNVTETHLTSASWTAPCNGKYFITVVAFNRALEPSRAVCSDGVTIK